MNYLETVEMTPVSRPADAPVHTPGAPVRVTCQWLYEGTGNRLGSELGRTVHVENRGLDSLVLMLAGLDDEDRLWLDSALSSYDSWRQLPRDTQRRIEAAVRPVRSAAGWQALVTSIEHLVRFRGRLLEYTPQALQRRLALAPESDLQLELELPVLDKRHWRGRFEALSNCRIEVNSSGRLAARLANASPTDCFLEHQTALVIAAGLVDCPGGFRLSFADERVLPRSSFPLTLAPLLKNYGADLPAVPEHWKRVRASITVSAPGSAARAWRRTPKERTMDRYAAYTAMSQQTLNSLRVWMSYLHFGDPEFFTDRDLGVAMLVYQAGRPYFRKGKPEYAYDPMVPSSVALACHSIRARLTRMLEPVHTYLSAAELNEVARHYRPDKMQKIVEAAKLGNRRFLNLLALDGLVMDRFDKLGNACRRQREEFEGCPEEGPRHVLREAREVNRAFQGRLRRLSSLEDISWLGTLLTIEATAALATHYGDPSPVELVVRLENADAQVSDSPVVVQASKLPPGPPR